MVTKLGKTNTKNMEGELTKEGGRPGRCVLKDDKGSGNTWEHNKNELDITRRVAKLNTLNTGWETVKIRQEVQTLRPRRRPVNLTQGGTREQVREMKYRQRKREGKRNTHREGKGARDKMGWGDYGAPKERTQR